MSNLPDGLTRKHIEDAINRGDHQMVYRGATINVDELWKMIQESENKKDMSKNDIRGKFRTISEQSEKNI
jgi:hypothetical protein